MPECARCGDFTDNPAQKHYNYCDNCQDLFNDIRSSGIVIEPIGRQKGYDVRIASSKKGYSGGRESNKVDALARGQWLMDELGVQGIFTYHGSGSTWLIEGYLETHPGINRKVQDRISRVPDKAQAGLLARIKNLF